MNSVERREKRYLRRKEKRQDKIDIKSSNNSNIQEIFTFKNIFDKARRCTRNVGYKKSTINFKLHMFSIVSKTCNDLKNDCYIVGDTYKFQINERGKIRDIDAPHIKDRLVHKVISNDILIPIYDSKLIYDNGASSIGKGFSFAIKRVKKLLRKWYLKHGMNGYIILIDFSKFFENCDHDVIRSIHNKYINNSYTKKVIEDYLFVNDSGIALGIEIAQREALMVPNKLDKMIINKGNPLVRYMDDYCLICPTYEEAKSSLNEYIKLADSLHIIVNKKKTKITHISNPFIFCKWKYELLPTGKVINRPVKTSIYRQRRKLTKMTKKNINIEEIKTSIIRFCAYLDLGNGYKYITYLKDKYKCLFDKEK